MNLIRGFFRFIGIITFMAFIIFLLIENESTAFFCLIISVLCFGIILSIKAYKFYLVYTLKKKTPGNNPG